MRVDVGPARRAEPEQALTVELREAGIRGVVVLSAGFRETGADGMELERAYLQVLGKVNGARLSGSTLELLQDDTVLAMFKAG